MSGRYDDLMDRPCPTSKAHPRMPLGARAAQFAPFAALTGFEDVLDETARLTDCAPEPDDAAQAALNERLALLAAHIKERPSVRVTYFVPDEKKRGGAYLISEGFVRAIDPVSGTLTLAGGKILSLSRIAEITCDLFPGDE